MSIFRPHSTNLHIILLGTVIAIVLLPLLVGCNKRPDGILSDKKMADILADLSLVEALSVRGQYGLERDSMKKIMRQSIMMHHGVSETDFDSTLVWYGHNMEQYAKLYKRVDKVLAQRAETIIPHEDQQNENNLWPLPKMLAISPYNGKRGFSFTMTGNSISPGDMVQWSMNITGGEPGGTIILAAQYPDKEMSYVRATLNEHGLTRLSLQTDSARRPNSIIGYVHYRQRPMHRIWFDSITLVTKSVEQRRYSAISNQQHITPPKKRSSR